MGRNAGKKFISLGVQEGRGEIEELIPICGDADRAHWAVL